LVPPEEWLPRAAQWLDYLSTAFGAWPVTLAVAASALWGGIVIGNTKTGTQTPGFVQNEPKLRSSIRKALLGFCGVYFLAHIMLPYNLYDRYLLLVYPPLIVLAACGFARLTPRALTVPALGLVLAAALSVPARFP